MPIKKVTEIPTIDVVMVTVKATSGADTNEYIIMTSNKIAVEPLIEVTEGTKLIIKNRLIAQKPEKSTLIGHNITLTDNVFSPELVKLLQGGTIKFDEVETTKVIGYTPPVTGDITTLEPLELCAYSAQYNAAGQITRYEKITYPNCAGAPVAFGSEDGVFRAPEYKITSTPDTGVAPYDMDYVDTLPVAV
jgi:hypothetical protein